VSFIHVGLVFQQMTWSQILRRCYLRHGQAEVQNQVRSTQLAGPGPLHRTVFQTTSVKLVTLFMRRLKTELFRKCY